MALLGARRAEEAFGIARSLRDRVPSSVDAWHLEALCAAELEEVEAADAAFSQALRLAEDHPLVLANQARWFARTLRPQRARHAWERAASVSPLSSDAALGHAGALLSVGHAALALEAFELAGRLGASALKVALGRAAAHRMLGDLDAAVSAAEDARRLAPEALDVAIERALLSRLQGRPGDALALLSSRPSTSAMQARELDALVGVLVDLLRIEEAHGAAAAAVERFPEDVHAHLTLANLRWEYPRSDAEAEAPFAALEEAIEQAKQPAMLKLALSGLLLEARKWEAAAPLIAALRSAGDNPRLQALAANALEMSGDHEAASALYRQADRHLRDEDAGFGNAYVRHLLRAGRIEEAAARGEANLAIDPGRQETWAYLATAWRLLGDPREEWLCRYDSLVSLHEIPTPKGWGSLAGFLADLEACLLPYHRARRAPMAQSLRSGTQTPGRLFGRDDEPIRALREVLRQVIAPVVAGRPREPDHPFLKRASPGFHFAGSWSVRLWRSGSHANHFHNEGWMSSAFYVSLPPSTLSGVDRSGWLQFGQPPAELGLSLPPRRTVQPRPGMLALFPSFLWHGTVPFDDDVSRLTVAFDVLPAGLGR